MCSTGARLHSGDPDLRHHRRPYGEELGREPGRLRVGMSGATRGDGLINDARAAVEGCAKLLAGLGHDVHDGYPAELDQTTRQLLGVSVAASVAHELDI